MNDPSKAPSRNVWPMLTLAAAWLAVELAAGPTSAAGAAGAAPPEGELRPLVTATLLAWNAAVQGKDFTTFRATCAAPLREKLSPADWLKTFDPFVAKRIDIAGVGKVPAAFDAAPAVDADGVLGVAGRYPTSPAEVRFALRFVIEEDHWRPLSVRVDLTPTAPPAEAEVKRLAASTMADFAAAVTAKDFAPLLARGSAPFRQQVTPDQLAAAFAPFLGRAIDWSPLASSDPALDAAPTLTAGPTLHVQGHYPLPGGRATFQLQYFRDPDGPWRLLAIEVKTGK